MERDEEARLRIAFCHHASDVNGGSDRSLFDLVTNLPRDRFECIMLLRAGDPMAEAYTKAGIAVRTFRLRQPRRALELGKQAAFLLAYAPSVFALARTMRKLKVDLVHVNTLFNLQGPVAARLAGKPLVWHVRELGSGGPIDRLLVALVCLLATRAVAISNAVADSLAACGPRCSVIFNGIDLTEYAGVRRSDALRLELGARPGEPLVAVVGRLEPWKGQHVFIEAIPRILARAPRARFAIVGGAAVNKPEYERQLMARCEELNLSERVRFTGLRQDIPAVLAACDALALPTATAEPFGRILPEAMAAGCPVVATAAGGPLDIVVDGETGYLVPPGDAGALADKIVQVVSNPENARRMAENARARAQERFSLERVVEQVGALFVQVANERHGGTH